MKKCFSAVLLLFLLLSSCSQKKQDTKGLQFVPSEQIRQNRSFIVQKLFENKTPLLFDNLMYTRVYRRDFKGYLFELNNPDCRGIKDSSGFYCDACDNGQWVDDILLAMEEERMGEETLSMLEDQSLIAPPENAEEIEKIFTDSGGSLKIMEFGRELFIPQYKADSSVLTHYSDKTAIRLFYDSLHRLTKKELWKMESVQNASITLVESYEYQENARYASSKTVENNEYKLVSKLNPDGLIVEALKYSIGQDSALNLVSKSSWKYDQEKRVTEELVTEYAIENDKEIPVNEKKQKFLYNEGADLYEYYENGILKIKTEYSEKGKYATTIFFDSHSSVTTWYEDYVKVRDLYITDGVKVREKVYEKPQGKAE